MRQAGVDVQAPAPRHRGLQGLEVGDDHRAAVDVQGLDRQPAHALGQIVGLAEQALAQRGGVQAQQLKRVMGQIPDDQLILVAGVAGQRPDQAQAAALGRVHARDVQQRPAGVTVLAHEGPDLLPDRVLLAQLQAEVEQLGLAVTQQPCQRDGGAHVAERIVRGLVQQAVGGGQVLQLEGRPAVGMGGPFDALGPQRIGAAHHVQDVPAAAVVLPLAAIGVDQIAPEQVARDLVVEAQGVVAHAHGAGLTQCLQHRGGKLVLGHALGQAGLRRDAGEQAALGVGQAVGCGLAVQHHRVTDLVERGVGAYAGKLGRPVSARYAAEGFVVVPEKAEGCHGGSAVGAL